MLGLPLLAGGLPHPIPRGVISSVLVFAGSPEALSLWRRGRQRPAAQAH